MENKLNSFTAVICVIITVALAVTLAVNGIQALFGLAKFAYWHLGTLAMMAFFSWVQVEENPEVKEWCAEAVRRTRFRLQKHSRTIFRAVRSLAALFTFRPFNRPQTEP